MKKRQKFTHAIGFLAFMGAVFFAVNGWAATVTSTSPVDGAVNVDVNADISVIFSAPMSASTITNSTFYIGAGPSGTIITVVGPVTYNPTPVAGTVAYTGTTATLNPSSALQAGTTYTATVTTGVKDSAGTPLAANYTWSFTTAGTAAVPPASITSTTPADNASADPSTSITVNFSKTMNGTTITPSTFFLRTGTGCDPVTVIGCDYINVPGTVTYSGTTATFTPSSPMEYGKYYSATITTGVKDSSGNPLESDYTWSFITGAGDAEDGDINGDGTVDIGDAILALQILAGLNPPGVYTSADVNADGRIGFEDAIFVLRTIIGVN